jgi:mannitol/fructose-specific phosphotransferase system IIA component (Ntr-type)
VFALFFSDEKFFFEHMHDKAPHRPFLLIANEAAQKQGHAYQALQQLDHSELIENQ